MPPAAALTFLSEDIRRQQEMAQEALNEAKRVDDLLRKDATRPEDLKKGLEETRRVLIGLARGLAANSTITSSSGSHLLSAWTAGKGK